MELICNTYLYNNRFKLPLHDLPRLNGMYYRPLGPSQVTLAPLYTIIGAKVWILIGHVLIWTRNTTRIKIFIISFWQTNPNYLSPQNILITTNKNKIKPSLKNKNKINVK